MGSRGRWVGHRRRLAGLASRLGIDELFFELMASTGYLEVATFETESEQRQVAANLAKFGELIDGFCDRRRDHSLGAFMAYLELVLLSETDEEVAQGEEVETAVQVMTIHQAKGLEFDAVFVPRSSKAAFPSPIVVIASVSPPSWRERRAVEKTRWPRSAGFSMWP